MNSFYEISTSIILSGIIFGFLVSLILGFVRYRMDWWWLIICIPVPALSPAAYYSARKRYIAANYPYEKAIRDAGHCITVSILYPAILSLILMVVFSLALAFFPADEVSSFPMVLAFYCIIAATIIYLLLLKRFDGFKTYKKRKQTSALF